MTTKELAQFRERIGSALLEMEGRTTTMRNDLLQVAEDQPAALRDEIDHAQVAADLSTRLEINDRNLLTMAALKNALARIVRGTFGLCESCEEDIDPRRIEAHPTARLCMSCQARKEGAATALVHPAVSYRAPSIFGALGNIGNSFEPGVA